MRERVAEAERVAALQESLSAARRQLELQAAHSAELQSQLASVEGDLATSRSNIGRLIDERDSDHRRFAKQLADQAEDRRRLEERSASAERRLLSEVDRARQEAKEVASRLEKVQRERDSERESALRERERAMQRHSALEIHIASLSERFAAAEQRETELRAQLQQQTAAAGAPVARGARHQAGGGAQLRVRSASNAETGGPPKSSRRKSTKR